MSAERVTEQPKSPPTTVYCRACSGWVGTVPAGTAWIRTRCINKRCRLYSVAQQIKVV